MALVQDVFMPDDDEQHELALHNLAESQRKANKALQIANSVIGTAFYVLNSTAQQEKLQLLLDNCSNGKEKRAFVKEIRKYKKRMQGFDFYENKAGEYMNEAAKMIKNDLHRKFLEGKLWIECVQTEPSTMMQGGFGVKKKLTLGGIIPGGSNVAPETEITFSEGHKVSAITSDSIDAMAYRLHAQHLGEGKSYQIGDFGEPPIIQDIRAMEAEASVLEFKRLIDERFNLLYKFRLKK